MNYCAYELLNIVYACECIGHPEMIPSPKKIRMDAEFSDALDYLLDSGYLIACKSRHSDRHVEVLAVGLGFFDFTMESLTITPAGIAALEEESSVRMNLRCCS
jgi:hypothetical protein